VGRISVFFDLSNWSERSADILVGFGAYVNHKADKNVGAPKN
jgi:hypothetical protein